MSNHNSAAPSTQQISEYFFNLQKLASCPTSFSISACLGPLMKVVPDMGEGLRFFFCFLWSVHLIGVVVQQSSMENVISSLHGYIFRLFVFCFVCKWPFHLQLHNGSILRRIKHLWLLDNFVKAFWSMCFFIVSWKAASLVVKHYNKPESIYFCTYYRSSTFVHCDWSMETWV